MLYFLMHENDKLALFNYEKLSINEIVINEKNIDKLPLAETDKASLKASLMDWFMHRGIPATRHGIREQLANLTLESPVEYMLCNLGLSLTDHYWVCPGEKKFTWEEIDSYTNEFQFRYSLDLSDDERSIAGKTNFVPSGSLKGDLKKKWIIDERGIRRLVKGNYGDSCRQSLCEVLATEIHRRQGKFEYTPYELINISSDGQMIVGCECPNFTTIDTEFVPAIDILNSRKKSNSSNYYETYIQYCGAHGADTDYLRAFMEYQILTDFIITNTDRHLNNFGMIRDSRTFRFIKPAPIFDSGNSMFYNTNNIKTGDELLNIQVTSFRKFEVELLKYVTDPELVDTSRLPSEQEVRDLFLTDRSTDSETAVKLAKAYAKKVELLRELQAGIRIYSYDYLRKHNIRLDKRA